MENQTEFNGFRNWFGESILIKVGLIGLLTILLLIPSSGIQDLISERQKRQEEVIKEVSDKWSGSQLIEGPVMIIPYKKFVNFKDASGKISLKESFVNIYVLPEELNIVSNTKPEVLHRGIFDAIVYTSKIAVKGKFSAIELKKSGISLDLIQWDKAKIVIGLSDLKGLKNNPKIIVANRSYEVEPDFNSIKIFTNNMSINPDLTAQKSSDLPFSFDLDLRGSSELSFLHLGKNTYVNVNGKWNNPSFIGRYLPEERKISDSSFSAVWKMPSFNRPFPQQWIEESSTLLTKDADATFGVKFILPIDQYQKTMRTAKYAILIIVLTFVSLFFTELINRKKVHLLQYVLIGVATTIYYVLLLSFSEHVGFDLAYLIASLATIILIGVFISALLKNKKSAFLFTCILSIFYGFIYVIIQLQDLSLLVGSVGLFIITAIMMYLSAKIDWSRSTETGLTI